MSLLELPPKTPDPLNTNATVDNKEVAVLEVLEEDDDLVESEKKELSMLISPDSEKDLTKDKIGRGTAREGTVDGEVEGDDRSFDFVVDGARFLPDNTNITKVYVFFLDDNGVKVDNPEGCLPMWDGSMYHPEYNFRVSIHEEKYFLSGLHALCMIVTFDDYSSTGNEDLDLIKS